MVLTVFGINHRTTTLSEREPFQLSRNEIGEAALLYKRFTGVDETAIIATCNRIEFYRAHSRKGRHGLEVVEFYRRRGVEAPERILDLAYRHVGAGAARHLFRVCSGMDSLVLGEEQIRGQVKDAYSAACAFGGPGKTLHKLFHHAFRVSKRIGNETALVEGVRSIPGAAVKMLLEKNSSPELVLVVGVNETTEIILKSLARRKTKAVIVNRTDYAASKVAAAFGSQACAWEELPALIKEADLIFSATASKDYVIDAGMVRNRDTGKRLLIVDLAIPRDVDPGVGSEENVELFDLQDMKHHLEQATEQRNAQLPEAQEIIEQQVDEFLEWLHAQTFAGGIEAVKSELHDAADEELNRFKGSFHKSENKALEAFSHALIKRFLKIAHRHFEPGDIGDLLVARTDPAAMETPGVRMTFVPALPENGSPDEEEEKAIEAKP